MLRDMNPSTNTFTEGLINTSLGKHVGMKIWLHSFLTLALDGHVNVLDE
jgi:hypothetical protein